MTEGRGEASDAAQEGTESLPAKRDTQSPATGESHRRPPNPIEPPWYGPVCPVVWEGRSREAPPYPDEPRAAADPAPRNGLGRLDHGVGFVEDPGGGVRGLDASAEAEGDEDGGRDGHRGGEEGD